MQMAAPRIVRWIVEDWWLKILALIAAVLLWGFARLEREYTREIKLGLDLSLLPPEYTVVEKNVDSVTVEIKGKGRYLFKLGASKPAVLLPLATMKEGTERLRIGPENINVPEQVQVRSLDPYQIELRIERRAQRRVKVIVPVVGKPRQGSAVSAIDYDNAVMLYGSKDALSGINQLFADSLDLQGVSESFVKKLSIPLPYSGGLTVIPTTILVRVKVEAETTLVFTGIPVQIEGIPLQGQAYLLEETVDLTLKGPVSLVRNFGRDQLRVVIDVSSRGYGDYRIPADVYLPPGIQVSRSDPETFRVLVR